MLESEQKGKFSPPGQKFALLHIKNQRKTQDFQGAESIYMLPISSVIVNN